MDKVFITIIGAGVVGLAVAAELSKKHKDIVVLEKEASFGQGTSSRNSEVIHAGIYYPKDSLKAKLCVEGNRLLYSFCREHKIPRKKMGKLIVAIDEDEKKSLHELEKKGRANGVEDLVWLQADEISALEPAVSAKTALFSPNTGIIDSHGLMKTLEALSEFNGAIIAYNSEVAAIKKVNSGYIIQTNNADEFETEILINSAGLFSDKIAAMAGIDIEKNGYKLRFCKGEYFSYSKPSFLKRLVYPVPEQDIKGLGIHSVLDLAGALKFGPNAEYVDKIDYQVDPLHREQFHNSIRALFPQVEIKDLQPDQAGVRPKLQGPGEEVKDFVIREESLLGFPGLISLIGIESPGLTASLAIAKMVLSLVSQLKS